MAKGTGSPIEVAEVTENGEVPAVYNVEPKKSRSLCIKKALKSNLILILMVLAMLIGIAMGIGIRFSHPEFTNDDRKLMYLAFPGYMVLRMLKVIIIPLIVTSLISSLANMPRKAQGRLGGFTILYYLITTFLAVLLGILLVCTIKPGLRRPKENVQAQKKFVNGVDSFLDLIRNLIPQNIIEATFRQTKTTFEQVPKEYNKTYDMGNGTLNFTTEIVNEGDSSKFDVVLVNGTDTLGLIVFSIALGAVISRMGTSGRPLAIFFEAFSQAIINLVKAIIWVVPIGIVFLVAHKIVSTKNLGDEFSDVGWYILTVLIGLGLHGFVVLPVIFFIFRRANPFRFMFHMTRALVTALGTASSSATLPITLKCLEEKARINPIISRFVLPVGATVNMDGTALYEAVASIFIAQQRGHYLGPSEVVIVSVTATAAAIGAAGVPEAGLVTMLIVLQALGLPSDSIGAILAVDWFLDRCRTSVNVWGDSVGAAVVESLSSHHMAELEAEEIEEPDHPPPDYHNYYNNRLPTNAYGGDVIVLGQASDSTHL